MAEKDQEPERLVGSVLGKRFEIKSLAGTDQAGARYEAADSSAGTTATVRVIDRLRPDDATLKQLVRLLTEVSNLDIPGIKRLRGVGRTRTRDVYYATDAVPGQSLAQRLEKGPMPPGEAADLICFIAEILGAAHKKGVVHGALHPGAVVFEGKTAGGGVHLLDFGLGSLLMAGEGWPSGTQNAATFYQAPELAKGDAFDHRADIYALGALLFEALTGSPPFAGQSPLEVLACQLRGEAPSLAAVDPSFEGSPMQNVVNQCMKVQPGERFASVDALIGALLGASRQEATRKRPAVAKAAAPKGKAAKKGPPAKGRAVKPSPGPNKAPARPVKKSLSDSSETRPWLWYALGATLLVGGVTLIFVQTAETTAETNPLDSLDSVRVSDSPPTPEPTKTPAPVAETKQKTKQPPATPEEQDNAGKAVEAAAQRQPEPLPERVVKLVDDGQAALAQGNYGLAVARFRSARRSAPDSPVIARGLGLAYLNSGQTEAAARELRRYLELDPNPADGMMIRHTLRQLGE